MREIKFRVWDNIEKIMWFSDFSIDCKGYLSKWKFGEGYTDFKDNSKGVFEVMQFTGLKDKNGKDIYEGDIIETEIDLNLQRGVVAFRNGTFCWKIKTPFGFCFPLLPSEENMWIKGNVYENPGLLEEK